MLKRSEALNEVKKNFNFLISDYGFKGPFQWNIAYEQEYTYVNGQIYINIAYDGAFFVSIGKTRKFIKEFSTGQLHLEQISYKEQTSHDIYDLLSKEEKIKISNEKNAVGVLVYLANVIRKNSEILYGNWYKFSFFYRLSRLIFKKRR